MYTEGIRKIFTPKKGTLDNVCDQADMCGYKALTFNGKIFIRHEHKWVETIFEIDDFKA